MPAVQRFTASSISDVLSEKLQTQVNIGNISIGLLNRIIIDDFVIHDLNNKEVLSSRRLSATFDVMKLLQGNIVISSAQIFSLRADIIKADSTSDLNCKFIIDALSSKDTTNSSPFNIEISSLVIRNTNVNYNQLDMPYNKGIFDINHLKIENISSHLMLYTLSNERLSARLKKLSFAERNSGFNVNNLSFITELSNEGGYIKDLNIQTDNSDISLDITASLEEKKLKSFDINSYHSAISTNDLGIFIPGFNNVNTTFFVDTHINGNKSNWSLENTRISTSNRQFALRMNGWCETSGDFFSKPSIDGIRNWNFSLNQLSADGTYVSHILNSFGINAPIVSKLGVINLKADAICNNGETQGELSINTVLGSISGNIHGASSHYTLGFNTPSPLRLGVLSDKGLIGDCTLDVKTEVSLTSDHNLAFAKADINIPSAIINNYPYRNINIGIDCKEGQSTFSTSVNDNNLNANIEIGASNVLAILNRVLHPSVGSYTSINGISDVNIASNVSHINPYALNLSKKYGPLTSFSFKTDAYIAKIDTPLDNFSIDISKFFMQGEDEPYFCNKINLTTKTEDGGKRCITMSSDFADITIQGVFNAQTLSTSLNNIIAKKLPTLPGIGSFKEAANNISIDAKISNTSFIRRLAGIEIYNDSPICLSGFVNDTDYSSHLTLKANDLRISGMSLQNTLMDVYTEGDTLNVAIATQRRSSTGNIASLNVNSKAADNALSTSVSWQTDDEKMFCGRLNTRSSFDKTFDGQNLAKISVEPSEVVIGDSLWHIRPSEVIYTDNYLSVDHFIVEHGKQHLHVNGHASRSAEDSLVVDLHDINVAYILNLVDFHSVEFKGYASGKAVAKQLFSSPDAHANLTVSDFLFEEGRMGTLSVKAQWDNELGQINLKAKCNDPEVIPEEYYSKTDKPSINRDGTTDIDGYVSIRKNYIDLRIQAENTRAEFMQTFCSSFMDNVNIWANGEVRIWGDLSEISLTGSLVADGNVFITPLGTTYNLKNDSIDFVHNDIRFSRCRIYDINGNHADVTGAIHHKYLSRMTFDINVEAKHLLCFDDPYIPGKTFCGHVIGSGTCKMTGRPGEILFDIDAYPEKSSEIVYNVSSPDAIQNQEFISWRDISIYEDSTSIDYVSFRDTSKENSDETNISKNHATDKNTESEEVEDDEVDEDFETNIRMNFLIHANTDNTLRLIMDEQSGDYITLKGAGTLRANYYNKGGMQLYGNYTVENGVYKMTMQKVISKNFDFLPGGTIVFGGDPYDAIINLKAQYIVPSVPLSDLNIGNSFSKNNVRVNCIMNITGTAEHPTVDFDLNLPQASADIQQMITSIMDSEQERTQQVIYLLSVGRFYAGTNINNSSSQSQASLAMQSFLSGTISQQINNVISDVVLKNNNWNFGANISPGDEGMMNAEYEGLFSGSMLDNRLLINGQVGYRDNANATTSFIGDFDIRYLIFPNGNLQFKVYNQTSDRYFTKSNLNTQGVGIVFKHDFSNLMPKFLRRRKYQIKSK